MRGAVAAALLCGPTSWWPTGGAVEGSAPEGRLGYLRRLAADAVRATAFELEEPIFVL